MSGQDVDGGVQQRERLFARDAVETAVIRDKIRHFVLGVLGDLGELGDVGGVDFVHGHGVAHVRDHLGDVGVVVLVLQT